MSPAIRGVNAVFFNRFHFHFRFLTECNVNTYEDAINKLKNMHVKAPNIIFASHIPATAHQKPGQSLREFVQNLQSLSKDCNFRAVTG